jgi:hypothetical protein
VTCPDEISTGVRLASLSLPYTHICIFIDLSWHVDVHILITRERTNRLQYSVCASARSYPQGIAFFCKQNLNPN